jgi:hypothetical protein
MPDPPSNKATCRVLVSDVHPKLFESLAELLLEGRADVEVVSPAVRQQPARAWYELLLEANRRFDHVLAKAVKAASASYASGGGFSERTDAFRAGRPTSVVSRCRAPGWVHRFCSMTIPAQRSVRLCDWPGPRDFVEALGRERVSDDVLLVPRR